MLERRQIVACWRQGGGSVLITLVRAQGSSYRQPGARLLTAASASGAESYAGTISGGCLEGEAIRRARWFTRDRAHVERYSTAFDDTAEIPFGLGCGGIVDLLFEDASTLEADALFSAMSESLQGRESTVVTFLPGDGCGLRRLVFDAEDNIVFASEGLSATRIECARALVPGMEYEGRYVERLAAPQRLVVFGAGDDARPLVSIAASLGWSVVLADGRPQLARRERFPQAERVLVVHEPYDLQLRPEDAVVLMTHSYEQDRALLAGILRSAVGPGYLGLLGARHRSSLLVSEAAAFTGLSLEQCCKSIFAPVGLDLGGDGPEAIALAIVAEVQAWSNGRLGISRKLTPAEVEDQIAQGGASRYLQAQCAMDVELGAD